MRGRQCQRPKKTKQPLGAKREKKSTSIWDIRYILRGATTLIKRSQRTEAPIGPCEAYRSSKKENNVKPKKDGGPFFMAWADNIWNDTYTESSWHLKK